MTTVTTARGTYGPAGEVRFEFGKNWTRFLERMTEDRLEMARRSIRDFTGLGSLEGISFVDVGCGSGLFSWAAHHLGARRILSFDYDPRSVACCAELKKRSGDPETWQVARGSILDEEYVRSLGGFDMVYSWGVLHHTGDMWKAIDNALSLVADRGRFYIAIYNKKKGWRGSRYWERRKRLYCELPAIGKKILAGLHCGYFAQAKLFRGKNPVRSAREYDSMRGMDWYTDALDWIGGYPYEYASIPEVLHHVRELDPSVSMLNVSGGEGLGCNQYLFRRGASSGDQRPASGNW